MIKNRASETTPYPRTDLERAHPIRQDQGRKKMNLIKCLSHTKWGADQENLIKIHRMIILSTLRYGEEAYGSASHAILKKTRTHTQQRVKVSPRTIRDLSNGKYSVRGKSTSLC
jgi:hypothetical protein